MNAIFYEMVLFEKMSVFLLNDEYTDKQSVV